MVGFTGLGPPPRKIGVNTTKNPCSTNFPFASGVHNAQSSSTQLTAKDKEAAFARAAVALQCTATKYPWGIRINAQSFSENRLKPQSNALEKFIQILSAICYLRHSTEKLSELEKNLTGALQIFITNDFNYNIRNKKQLCDDLITLATHRDHQTTLSSLPAKITYLIETITSKSSDEINKTVKKIFAEMPHYINYQRDQASKNLGCRNIKTLIDELLGYTRGNQQSQRKLFRNICPSDQVAPPIINSDQLNTLFTKLSDRDISELIKTSLKKPQFGSIPSDAAPPEYELTFLETIKKPDNLLSDINTLIKNLITPLYKINQQLEITEKIDLIDIHNIAMLVIMYKDFIIANFQPNKAILFSKHLIDGYHSLLLFKNDKNQLSVLIKPIIKNGAIDLDGQVYHKYNLIARGGEKLFKLSAILLEFLDNLLDSPTATRCVTLSKRRQYKNSNFAKVRVDASYLAPKIDQFMNIEFYLLSTRRLIYIQEYLGVPLPDKILEITQQPRQENLVQQLQNLCLQLCQIFRLCYYDVKPDNILVADDLKITYIDYSSKEHYTFVCKTFIDTLKTNRFDQIADDVFIKNALLGLCYTMFIIVSYQIKQENAPFNSFNAQFFYRTYANGKITLNDPSFAGDGFDFSSHPLKECLNKAYKGELQLSELENKLNEIFKTNIFTNAFKDAAKPLTNTNLQMTDDRE